MFSFWAAAFPAKCLGCSRAGSVLCEDCRPIPGASRTTTLLVATGVLPVRAAGRYAGPLRRAIIACKGGRRDAADALAALLVARCGAGIGERAVFVPVPTSPGRRRRRGFDQSVRLAHTLGASVGRPVLLALDRADTSAQHGRNRAARLRARKRFVCNAPAVVAGLQIVLVDDVVTTGATLRECAEALAACGAHVCEAVVVAYA